MKIKLHLYSTHYGFLLFISFLSACATTPQISTLSAGNISSNTQGGIAFDVALPDIDCAHFSTHLINTETDEQYPISLSAQSKAGYFVPAITALAPGRYVLGEAACSSASTGGGFTSRKSYQFTEMDKAFAPLIPFLWSVGSIPTSRTIFI